MQQWNRVHEFIRSRARFLNAQNVTKSPTESGLPHVLITRAPSRKRKRSPSTPASYTEFVLKKVNIGSDEAITQVALHVHCRFLSLLKSSVAGCGGLRCFSLRFFSLRHKGQGNNKQYFLYITYGASRALVISHFYLFLGCSNAAVHRSV
jgi:hypothetical protein